MRMVVKDARNIASTRYMLTEISEKMKWIFVRQNCTEYGYTNMDMIVNAAFKGDELCVKVLERGCVSWVCSGLSH